VQEPGAKFRESNIVEFMKRVSEDKCERFVAFYLQDEKETGMINFLKESRK